MTDLSSFPVEVLKDQMEAIFKAQGLEVKVTAVVREGKIVIVIDPKRE